MGGAAEYYLGWHNLAHNLLEGLVRLVLLVGYIWGIGFMPDVKRLFGYHGAEHKTINAHEAGVELTPQNGEISAGASAPWHGVLADVRPAFRSRPQSAR
ncbi:MAG: DUF1385 domain-containing protein [Anaerolineales bacterium]